MRLVKKTVNFDNHSVYHFYYGDEHGAPGTIWTTFPYKNRGVRTGIKGAGQVVTTSFSVPYTSLEFWRKRLTARGVALRDVATGFGEEAIRVTDPSGLSVRARRQRPRHAHAMDRRRRGRRRGDTRAAQRDDGGSLGDAHARADDRASSAIASSTRPRTARASASAATDPATRSTSSSMPMPSQAVNGIGTVHHVAMAISRDDEQRLLREELLRMGLVVTEIRDRCYFQSIYFREPGGVLFEVATVEPGFTADEDLPLLGRQLKLPPWEEPHRAADRGDAAARGVSLTCSHMSGQPVVEAGVPLGQAPGAVIMVHGRNAEPANILDLVPRLSRPQPQLSRARRCRPHVVSAQFHDADRQQRAWPLVRAWRARIARCANRSGRR